MLVPGDDDPDGLNLIDAGIGAVEDLRVGIEANFALNLLFELVFDVGVKPLVKIRHTPLAERVSSAPHSR